MTQSPEDIRDRSTALSRSFSALKWFLALTVVADHFFRFNDITVGATVYRPSTFPFFPTICGFVENFLQNFAVPIFFFMSGYLSYKENVVTPADWVRYVWRKSRSLAVPFISFTIFAILVFYLLRITPYLEGEMDARQAFKPFLDPHATGMFIGNVIGWNGYFPYYNIPLWYLRDLICIIILLPVFHFVVKRVNPWILIPPLALLFITLFGVGRGRPEMGLLFFTWGYSMRYRRVDIGRVWRNKLIWLLPVFLLLAAGAWWMHSHNAEYARLLKNSAIVLGIPVGIGVFHTLASRRIVEGSAFLAAASFFLYATHRCIIPIIYNVAMSIATPADGSFAGTAALLVAYVVLVAATVGIFRLLQVFAPKFTAMICGNRI